MNPTDERFAGLRPTIPPLRTAVLAGPPAVAGLTLGWREGGTAEAPALVCLHGIGSNATGYRYQFDGFGGRLRVVAWDAPGYGLSTPLPADSPSAADYADAVAGLLDTLAIGDCHLCGSSMGAVIAVAFAARYPHRLRSLILSAPAPSAEGVEPAARAARAQQRIDDLERLGAATLAEQRAAFLLAPDSPPAVLAAARELVGSVQPRGYGQGARMVANTEYMAAAARIRTPTLIFRGTEDKLGAGAAPLHAAIAGAEFVPFEGVGHMIKLEAPALFNRRIADFIRRHATG